MSKNVTFVIAGLLLTGLGCIYAIKTGPWRIAAGSAGSQPQADSRRVLRLGIIPERDVYQQHVAYRELADYLARQVGRVELRTSSSYAGALKDLRDGEVDAAFVGSLVAVLAHDQCGANVWLKSEAVNGDSTYAGVVFVREDSKAQKFEDLIGKRIGGVKTTTAGAVYPLYLIRQLGWAAAAVPELVWTGTHDDVMAEVAAGTLDAGAVKDSRYAAYVAEHPEVKFRMLSQSQRVPNNALVVRKELPAAEREKLVRALLAMAQDAGAGAVLQDLELKGFVPCDNGAYGALYDMIDEIGPAWLVMDVGRAPKRPAEATHADAKPGNSTTGGP